MIEWIQNHESRGRFKWVGYVPVDSGPFYPPWERVFKGMDEVVAMSVFGRDIIQSGIPSKRVHVIPHGVDTDVFRELPDRVQLKSHERILGKFVVGCVARNQSRKNIPALVEAFALVSKKHEDLHLYLHMSPSDVGYDLVTLLQRFRLQGRADISRPEIGRFEGLKDPQLNRLYNLFDISALPTMGEGFGLPIIESMSVGIPVVATDCSACTELVRGRGELVKVGATFTLGTNLLEQSLVDVGDLAACIEKLHQDRALLGRFAEAGRAFAETLAWDRLMPQWIEVIQCATGEDMSRPL